MSDWISVFSPATVANVGPAFDILAFTIDKPGDVIRGRLTDIPGVMIKDITGDNGVLPHEAEKNTAAVAAHEVLKALGEKKKGIELIIEKQMPIGSGLGSSAASAAGGAYVANLLLGDTLSREELCPLAGVAEREITGNYGENAVGSLLGGFVLVTQLEPLQGIRLGSITGLWTTVVYPHMSVKTMDARNVLPKEFPLGDSVKNSLNATKIVAGVIMDDIDLLKGSIEDIMIEPNRAQLIPGFYDVKQSALESGAFGCSIAGACPSVFAFSESEEVAKNVGKAMHSSFAKYNMDSDVYVSEINEKGVVRVP